MNSNNKETEDLKFYMDLIKLSDILQSFDDDNKFIVFEYIILLSEYSLEYLEIKYKNFK